MLSSEMGLTLSEHDEVLMKSEPIMTKALLPTLPNSILFQNLILVCFNPRPTKGGGYHPLDGLSPAAQIRKRKWPRASRTSLLNPLRSFWWKNPGYPWDRGRVSHQSSKVGGWLPLQNILSCHFEKYLHGMVLKLSGLVRNIISLLYKQKSGWNSDTWNFFSKKIDFFFNFGLFSLKIGFLSLAMFENVIVMSYIDQFSWFWYQ